MQSLRKAVAAIVVLAGVAVFVPGKVLADSARLSASRAAMNTCWADCPRSCCSGTGENCTCGCSGDGNSYCRCDVFRP